jgi:membrane-associated phospholipid phosphatase
MDPGRYGERMRARVVGWVVPWLLVAALGQLVALDVMRRVFVGTARGQLLDTAALEGNTIGRNRIEGLVDTVLSAVTLLSLAAATIAIGTIALMRGRAMLAAVATLLIAGANLTTQLLKYLIERPDFGVDLARAAAGNSLPSGHTTMAASVAVAVVLVLPSGVRGLAGLAGAGYAALAGVATMSAGWHRPSDAVAALLIVGVWAAIGGLLLAITDRRRPDRPASAPPHRFAVAALGLAGLVGLAAALVAMVLTDRVLATPVELLSRGRLLTAYAGGAAGIAGAASLVMAIVLATVHLIVPDRGRSADLPARPAASAAGPPAAPARVR